DVGSADRRIGELDVRLAGREVDRRAGDTVERPERALDAGRARRTGHPADVEIDRLGRQGGVGAVGAVGAVGGALAHDFTSRSMARLASVMMRSDSPASPDSTAWATQWRRWSSSSSTATLW